MFWGGVSLNQGRGLCVLGRGFPQLGCGFSQSGRGLSVLGRGFLNRGVVSIFGRGFPQSGAWSLCFGAGFPSIGAWFLPIRGVVSVLGRGFPQSGAWSPSLWAWFLFTRAPSLGVSLPSSLSDWPSPPLVGVASPHDGRGPGDSAPPWQRPLPPGPDAPSGGHGGGGGGGPGPGRGSRGPSGAQEPLPHPRGLLPPAGPRRPRRPRRRRLRARPGRARPARPRGAAAGAALGGAAGAEPQPSREPCGAQPRVLQPRPGAALLRRRRSRGARQPPVAGPAAADRQARVQGHAAHVPRLQPVHGGRGDAGAARRLLGRTGAVPGPGQEGQRRAPLQRGAPDRQVQGHRGAVAPGHRAPLPGVPRQRPPLPVRLGATLRGHHPSILASHAGRGLPRVLLQEQDPPEPPPQVGGGLGTPERVRLLARRALAGVREPGRSSARLPLRLHAAAGHDEELLRGSPLRLLEPRRALRCHRRRGRPCHRVVIRRGPRGGSRPRPQVVGQRRGFRSFHTATGWGWWWRRWGRPPGHGEPPECHLSLRLGRAGHAVLPVGPDRGCAGASAAPSPRPARAPRRCGGAAALPVALQQPPPARRGSPNLPAGPPRAGAERGALRHPHPAGPPREGAQALPQPGQHQPRRWGWGRREAPRGRPGGGAGVSGHGQGAGDGAVPAAARGAAARAARVQEDRAGEAHGAALPGGLHRHRLPGGAHLHLGAPGGLRTVLAERWLPEWHRGVAVTCRVTCVTCVTSGTCVTRRDGWVTCRVTCVTCVTRRDSCVTTRVTCWVT